MVGGASTSSLEAPGGGGGGWWCKHLQVVVRGERNTGKSALLARLQGKPFLEEYSATEEIQVHQTTGP